jgi:hypothetical protein
MGRPLDPQDCGLGVSAGQPGAGGRAVGLPHVPSVRPGACRVVPKWSPARDRGTGDRLGAVSSLAVGSGRLLEWARSSVRASAPRSRRAGVSSGCGAWSYLKWCGPSAAQPRPKAKYHGGCTEEDGGEPDFEVAERQGDDAARQQYYHPGHVVGDCQFGAQPTVTPRASVLGEPLELRWIFHPDRHLTACGVQTVLAVMLAGGRSGGVLAQVLERCPHRPRRAGHRYTSRRLGV